MLKTACGNGFPLNIPSVIPESGGSGGTSDYSELSNKPKINNVTLSGDKSAADLGLASADIEDLIPADASSSNQLATAADLPGLATTSTPGIVQPDGTSITISDGVISAVGGSGAPVENATSISGLKYIKQGNIVFVSGRQISLTAGDSVDVTGLPAPYNDNYALALFMSGEIIIGFLQYSVTNFKWTLTKVSSGGTNVGAISLTYISK